MLTQNWCEASGCGNGVGWTPRPKVSWSSLVAPWRTVWRCKVEKKYRAVFPPTGCLCLDDIKSSETTLQESANKVDSLSSWGAKHWRWYTNYLRKIFPAYHGQSRSQSPSFNIQVRGQDISNSENLYISGFSRVYTSTKYTKTAARKACYAKRRRRTHPAGNKASVLVHTRITQNNG